MDAVMKYHHQRVRDLLIRTRRHKTAPVAAGADGPRADPLQIPELLLYIAQFTPPRAWPSMCLVARLWRQTLQPLLWRHPSFHEEDPLGRAKKLAPWLSTFGLHIHTLDFDMRICPRLVSRILKSLSSTPFPALRSLRLQDSSIRTDEFVDAIQHLSGLRAVDLKYCRLNVHPLNLLAQNSLIESIAFTQDEVPLDRTHANIFVSWPYLKDLSIKGIDEPKAIGPTLILQEVITGSDLHLRSLELEDLPTWSEATVSRLIVNSPSMQKLWLKRCRVPKDLLATTPPSSLVSLQIILEENAPDDLPAILESNPRLRYLRIIQLSRVLIPPDRLAMMCRSLQVLWLDTTLVSSITPAEILKSLPLLRRLHIGSAYVSWSGLYLEGGGQLEELTFGAVLIAQNLREPQHSQNFEKLQGEFYAHLGRLTRLRRLELNFLLTSQKLPPSVHQIRRLSRLEHLTLMGGGAWTFQDVQWLAGSLVDLEELRCRSSEMSTPLWSWLRLNRPDLKVVIS